MKRYSFPENINKVTPEGILLEKTTRTIYKCDICGYELLWLDAWDDAKKEEVKAEVDAHDNVHIIPETTDA